VRSLEKLDDAKEDAEGVMPIHVGDLAKLLKL
jgi:hypothetical protein